MSKNDSEKRIDASKANLEVCSILLATVSLSFSFSNLEQLFYSTRVFVGISFMLALSFLALAIFLQADAIFNFSKNKENIGEYFDKWGYNAMRGGLFFVLILMNYFSFSLFPSILDIPILMSEILQVFLPIIFAIILYMLWRIFKCRKLGIKWYKL